MHGTMDAEWLRKVCLALPHTTEHIQWGYDLVFKVHGKMFAVAPLEPARVMLSFKCSDESFAELTERPDVIPAPYMARAKWVALETRDAIRREELEELLRASYELVFEAAQAVATRRCSRPSVPPKEKHSYAEKGKKKSLEIVYAGKSKLCGDFAFGNFGENATHGLGTRQGERHVPEIDFAGEEFEADVGLAIALVLNGGDAGFYFTGAAFVNEQKDLADHQSMIAFDLRPVLTDGIGARADGELLTVFVLTADHQRYGQSNALRATAFFTAKM